MEQLFENEIVADCQNKFIAEEEYVEKHFLEKVRFQNGQDTANPLHRHKGLRKRFRINQE